MEGVEVEGGGRSVAVEGTGVQGAEATLSLLLRYGLLEQAVCVAGALAPTPGSTPPTSTASGARAGARAGRGVWWASLVVVEAIGGKCGLLARGLPQQMLLERGGIMERALDSPFPTPSSASPPSLVFSSPPTGACADLAARAWALLRQVVSRFDNMGCNYAHAAAAAAAVLAAGGGEVALPDWLQVACVGHGGVRPSPSTDPATQTARRSHLPPVTPHTAAAEGDDDGGVAAAAAATVAAGGGADPCALVRLYMKQGWLKDACLVATQLVEQPSGQDAYMDSDKFLPYTLLDRLVITVERVLDGQSKKGGMAATPVSGGWGGGWRVSRHGAAQETHKRAEAQRLSEDRELRDALAGLRECLEVHFKAVLQVDRSRRTKQYDDL